jgi:rfaE bifunctional protein nucleotidyltransferase chain/domain
MRADPAPEKRVFPSADEVMRFIAPLRAEGKRVVTTNGCFDIVHSGHIRCLSEASRLGDLLVVGVNDDATVKRLKGPSRPVRGEADRVLVVASLAMVDAAFVFHEDDPRAFLDVIRPDVHVKGGDYTGDLIEREIVERHGGRVAVVSYAKGLSTTGLVKKIRSE